MTPSTAINTRTLAALPTLATLGVTILLLQTFFQLAKIVARGNTAPLLESPCAKVRMDRKRMHSTTTKMIPHTHTSQAVLPLRNSDLKLQSNSPTPLITSNSIHAIFLALLSLQIAPQEHSALPPERPSAQLAPKVPTPELPPPPPVPPVPRAASTLTTPPLQAFTIPSLPAQSAPPGRSMWTLPQTPRNTPPALPAPSARRTSTTTLTPPSTTVLMTASSVPQGPTRTILKGR